MGNIFSTDSKLMRVMSKIFDIGYLSIIFILSCLPVITIGAAFTALYYTTVKVIRKERGYVFQEYMRSFKLNFFAATKIWIVEIVIIVVMLFNITAVMEGEDKTSGFMLGAYIVLSVLVHAVSCYIYPILSRFVMKNTQIVRMSLYFVGKYIYFTVPLVIISGAAIVGVFILMPYLPILPLVVPGIASLLYSYIMEIILRKYTTSQVSETNEHGEEIKAWYND